jgi:hypothetical protein
MTTPVYAMIPENQLIPPPAFSLRARREAPTVDSANARMFEHWRTDTPSLSLDRPQPGKTARHMDMNPEASRINHKNYLQAQPYVTDGGGLGDNPYFQKYDVTQDPRNVVRELRTAVTEDRTDRGLHESKSLLSRSLVNRWIGPDVVKTEQTDTLSAYDRVMKPQANDMKKSYR